MIENIIGDKKVFAIEYSISKPNPFPPYGDCQIWLGGNCLGGIEGEVYLTRVSQILQSVYLILDKLVLPELIFQLSCEEIFKIMKEEQIDEKGTYWFMDTEGFDLLNKYVYYQSEMLYFIWQLNPDLWSEFKVGDFPGQLFFAKVPISTYTEVTNQFRDAVAKIQSSN